MKASLLRLVVVFAVSAAAFGQSRDIGAVGQHPASRPSSPKPPDGFTMVNGMLYESHNGQLQPVTRDVTLRISPNGVVTGFDGRAYAIPPGVILAVEAHVVPFAGAPAALSSATNAPFPATAENPSGEFDDDLQPVPQSMPFSVGTTTFVPSTVLVPGVVTLAPGTAVTPGAMQQPAAARRGQPVTNNPFSGAAPAASGVNTTATGNQQNTLGTQQIRPGMGKRRRNRRRPAEALEWLPKIISKSACHPERSGGGKAGRSAVEGSRGILDNGSGSFDSVPSPPARPSTNLHLSLRRSVRDGTPLRMIAPLFGNFFATYSSRCDSTRPAGAAPTHSAHAIFPLILCRCVLDGLHAQRQLFGHRPRPQPAPEQAEDLQLTIRKRFPIRRRGARPRLTRDFPTADAPPAAPRGARHPARRATPPSARRPGSAASQIRTRQP